MQNTWVQTFQKATGSFDINDYYFVYDKHEELQDEDKGILKNFDTDNSDIEIDPDRESMVNEDKESTVSIPIEKEKKEKKNEMLGKGRHNSVIVKILHKFYKNEVAMKEILKKGKSS